MIIIDPDIKSISKGKDIVFITNPSYFASCENRASCKKIDLEGIHKIKPYPMSRITK